jgi:hypothetical protein
MSSQLLASAYDVLSGPANGLLGRTGDDDGASNLPSPTALGNLSTWYDVNDVSSLELDASNRCQLIADKSGNSSENCLVLPGVAGNYASFTALTAFGTGDFSVSAKVTLTAVPPVYSAIIGGASNSFGLRANPSLKLQAAKNNASVSVQSTTAIALHTEVVIGYTRSGTTGTYYLNGVADGTITDAENYTVGSSEIGAALGGTFGPALANIKWARVYSTALDATAMAADAAGTIQANNTFAIDFSNHPKAFTNGTTMVASTGQTVTLNNTAIAMPARIHGARDLYMGTAASQPYYAAWEGSNYGYLNGVVGNRFTSPYDATYAITTGSIDIIACVALDNWTPPVSNAIVSRRQLSGIGICYSLRVDSSTGYLSFLWSPDGTSGSAISVTSGVAPTVSNFEKLWIRVFRTAATGAYVFYTSADGVSWTVLASGTGTSGSLFSNTTGIEIGGSGSGTILPTFGKIYSAQVWNGDSESGGTLVASFAASDYPSTGGSTFVSSATGETWTINGGAKIVTRTGLYFDGTADYMKTAPFALSQPENVYFVGEQVTWTSTDYLMDGAASNSGAITQTTSTPRLNISAGTSVAANTGLPVQTAGVVNAVFNGASSSLRINRGTATTGNAGSANMTGLTVASAGTAGTYGNLFLSEALIYDTTAQDTATQDRIALYEGQKWGILV